jgi:asparagine synthetase B (glutamine-hydrolysing)
MCGICGAIGLDSQRNAEAGGCRMLAAIVHRGPDEEGPHHVKRKRASSSPTGVNECSF